jgi:DNA-directed RNA polymerase specialized sigma24 family protein
MEEISSTGGGGQISGGDIVGDDGFERLAERLLGRARESTRDSTLECLALLAHRRSEPAARVRLQAIGDVEAWAARVITRLVRRQRLRSERRFPHDADEAPDPDRREPWRAEQARHDAKRIVRAMDQLTPVSRRVILESLGGFGTAADHAAQVFGVPDRNRWGIELSRSLAELRRLTQET